MRRNPATADQRNDYDPLDPESAYYQAARPESRTAEPEEPPAAGHLRAGNRRTYSDVRTARRPGRNTGSPRRKAVWTLVFFLAILLFLNLFVFRLRQVSIEGAGSRDPSQIARLAGLSNGTSIFSIHRSDIEKAISEDRYLKLTGFEIIYPSTLKLTVRQRGLCANVQFNSTWYMVDEDGVVLEKLTQAEPRNNLPRIAGMQVRDARLGLKLVPAREDQLVNYTLVMGELLSQGYVNQVSEIYVGDPKEITFITRSGYTVLLGSAEENLMAKIAVTRGIDAKLLEFGKEGGSIDVTDVAQPIYSP